MINSGLNWPMEKRYRIASALFAVACGLLTWGYYGHEDAIRSTESAENDAASTAATVNQDKEHLDFKSAGIITEYTRCHWTRTQINKVEPGKGDQLFKCEELKSYVEPAERLKAAWRQSLDQKCEQAIKDFIWDPGSYRFVDHLYIATEKNGIEVRLNYSESDGFGGRSLEQKTCSYQL